MKTLQVRNMPKSGQAGFTIIELIVVILLLGILTATALPRFLDVTDEAHAAVVDAVQGGLVTGGALFRAQFVAEGENAGTALAEFDSNIPNSDGYPVGTANLTLDSSADCLAIYQGLLQEGRPSIAAAAATGAVATGDTLGATTDFIAKMSSTNLCNYAYVSQFDDPANETVPQLTLNVNTGAVTASTL
jgi:prepilin-type N-terminal cleavage/methylation domain-containing protein